MHLRSFLSQLFLLAFYGPSALAAQTAAQVKAGLTELTADMQDLKTTAMSINPSAVLGDYTLYITFQTGKYKVTQDKMVVLTSKFSTFATPAAGSTGFSSTDVQDITNQYNQLARELSYACTGLLQKACLFSTTPAVGQDFANSANAMLGAYSSYSDLVRTIDPVISANTFAIFGPTYTQLQAVKKAYEGALCGI
ncbi:hypothetical protein V8F06_008930 [Rhypophila decipiens]